MLVARQRFCVPHVGQGRRQRGEGVGTDRLATAGSQVSETSARAPERTHGHVNLCFSDEMSVAVMHELGMKKKT